MGVSMSYIIPVSERISLVYNVRPKLVQFCHYRWSIIYIDTVIWKDQ
jgi:hypothetical protein